MRLNYDKYENQLLDPLYVRLLACLGPIVLITAHDDEGTFARFSLARIFPGIPKILRDLDYLITLYTGNNSPIVRQDHAGFLISITVGHGGSIGPQSKPQRSDNS